MQQPKLIPSQTNLEPKENSFIVHDDTLPVYLQPPPRRQSPPTRRPHHPAAGFAQVYTEAIHILPSKEPKMIHHFQDKNSGKQNLESKEVEEGRASKVEQRKPSITFAVNVHTDKIDENIRPQNSKLIHLVKSSRIK